MKHKLFLIDLDDTLLDYQASEQSAFLHAMQQVGFLADPTALLAQYRAINFELWGHFEAGSISADFLKVERFRRTFHANQLELDHQLASHVYLESFQRAAVLVEGAKELCEALSGFGEVGIMTNGVHSVQSSRLAASGLLGHVSFVSTSQACGFAKPDIRFFEHTALMAKPFAKAEAIIIGDRLEADILGANRYGIDSCWFNPGQLTHATSAVPTYEVAKLRDILRVLKG